MAFDFGNFLSGLGTGALSGAGIGSAFGPVGTAIGGVAGGLFGGFGNLGRPGAGDVTNVNPFTDPFMQQLQGQGQNFFNQMNQGMGNMTGMINSLDPTAAQNFFVNQGAGQMRDIAAQNMDPFSNMQRADFLSNQALGNISNFFGNQGPGAGRSGAGQAAMMEGALNPFTQMNQNLANMQTQQAGQLQQQNMSNLFNQFMGMSQLGIGAQGQQNALLAQLFGQNQAQQGGLAGNEFFSPQGTQPLGLTDMINAGGQFGALALQNPGAFGIS